MEVVQVRDYILFRTEYDDKHDLIQIFKGLGSESIYYNSPIDFLLCGLMEKNEKDCFRPSKIISFMTDEAAPCRINNRWTGADHAFEFGIKIKIKNHGLNYSFLATDFYDEDGISYTLLYILDKDSFILISQNLGENDCNYKYNRTVKGNLVSKLNGATFCPEAQFFASIKSNRTIYKGVSTEREDYAELYDEYDIVNLPSAVRQFKEQRPTKGYAKNCGITDFGDVMIKMKLTYRITADGTVFIIFDNEKKMPVDWHSYFGTMYQVKNNLFGGKTIRYIPNLGKVKDIDGNTVCLNDGFDIRTEFCGKFVFMTQEFRMNKEVPDRVIDIFYDAENQAKMGFACGYLPIDDGVPSKRNMNEDFFGLAYSKKAYPVFLSGNLERAKGVAYKKYFIPKDGKNIEYEITYNGKTYRYTV